MPQSRDELFRFAVVRPPATVPPDHLALDYLHYRDLGEETPLRKHIRELAAQGGTRDAITRAIVALAGSGELLTPDTAADAAVRHARAILELVLRAPEGSDPAALRATLDGVLGTGLPGYVASAGFRALLVRLWDTLIASFYAVRALPQLREEIIGCLRAAAVLVALAQDGPPGLDTLRRRARAVPIVPGDLFAAPPVLPDLPPGGAPHGALDPVPAVEDIVTTRGAWLEIDAAFRRGAAQARRAAAVPGPSPASPPGPGVKGDQAAPAGSWRLDTAAQRALSAATRTVLAQERLSAEAEGVPDILARLEDRLRVQVSRLAAGTGPVPVNRVGSRLVRPRGERRIAPAVEPAAAAVPEIRSLLAAAPRPRVPPPKGSGTPTASPARAVHVIGIGDLLLVEQELLSYQPGEISYVENVMRTEQKERVFRALDRTREVVTTETEVSQETTKDLQSTDRYELQQEAQNTIQSDASLETGLTVSGAYGPVRSEINADFSTSTSSSQATATATSYAQEVVDKSLQRIVERSRQRTVTAVLHETEETDTHGFDNRAGAEHVVGIYRWLDKYYQAQVVDYGKRLMLEFVVPEPAAFYVYAQGAGEVEGVTLDAPIDPGDLTPSDLTSATYEAWVVKYGAADVVPPPAVYQVAGIALDLPPDPKRDTSDWITSVVRDLAVPQGYRAKSATCGATWQVMDGGQADAFFVRIGRNQFDMNVESRRSGELSSTGGYTTPVPVSLLTRNVGAYILHIEVLCERGDELYAQWQLDTYAKIMAAYGRLRSAYDKQVAQAQATASLAASGRSPDANRAIEKEELKRSCITLFTGFTYDRFDAGGAVSAQGYPEIDLAEAAVEGSQIQFLEQAFEWDAVTYLFYPYFWGRKDNWVDVEGLDDVDPLFGAFLRAGAARVVVPVRPAYEAAVLYFLESGGVIWNGGEAPVIEDELYVSIVDELRAPVGRPRGKPWEVKVPTSLVLLQATSDLPGAGAEADGAAG